LDNSKKTISQLNEEIRSLKEKLTLTEERERQRIETELSLKESEERFKNLMDYIPGISIQGYLADGTVVYWNKASENVYGFKEEEALGKNLGDLIIPEEVKPHFLKALEIAQYVKKSGEFMPPSELQLLHKDKHLVPVYSIHTAVYTEGKPPMFFCIDVDITERKAAEKEKEELLSDIDKAQKEIITLQGFLPICSHCKKIRNDNGYWEQLESYISEHFNTEFTHGICPECMETYYHKKNK